MSDEIKTPAEEAEAATAAQPQEVRIPPTVAVKRSMKDNKILVWIVSNLLYPALALSAFLAAASMTFHVIGRILPGQVYMQWLAITFYDFGALVWFFMYVVKARGTPQRAISMLTFALDTLGVGLMIYAELNLGGQTLVTPPAWLGKWLINGTTAVMFLNLLAGWLYHMNSPEDRAAAREQDHDDKIDEVTSAQMDAYLDANIHNLAAPMFARSAARFKMRNGLQMTDADYLALEGVIDAATIPALPAGNRVTFWSMLGNFFVGRRRKSQPVTPSETNTASQPNPSPASLNEPQDNQTPQA